MGVQLTFSEEELELIVELLQHEVGELPVEIRHTRTSELRDQLRQRREIVRDLLKRLRTPAGA